MQMLTFFSCFCLFWHPALRLLWVCLHSMCSMKRIHTTRENVHTCSHTHLFVYATFSACLFDDGFRVCRGPASINCWEVLTVATGYSPELGYKLKIMASSLENDQFVAVQVPTISVTVEDINSTNDIMHGSWYWVRDDTMGRCGWVSVCGYVWVCGCGCGCVGVGVGVCGVTGLN